MMIKEKNKLHLVQANNDNVPQVEQNDKNDATKKHDDQRRRKTTRPS